MKHQDSQVVPEVPPELEPTAPPQTLCYLCGRPVNNPRIIHRECNDVNEGMFR